MRSTLKIFALGLFAGGLAHAQEVDDLMCQGRESCTLIATHDAGADLVGDGLTVHELGFAAQDGLDDGGWGCRFDPDGYEGGREFWLVDGGDLQPERLTTICNDGYGAAMIGEDAIEFDDNLLIQERYGGSAWRWVDAISMSLRPRRLLTHYLCSAYGPWTRYFQATDWQRSVTWYAWSPSLNDDETDWCPPLDPTRPQPAVPEPYVLGLMVPGYDMTLDAGANSVIAGVGTCGLGLADAQEPNVPADPAFASLRIVAVADPERLVLRLVLALDRDLAGRASTFRLDVARAEYEALDWLVGESDGPFPYRTLNFPTDISSNPIRLGAWTLTAGPAGADRVLYYFDRAPAADSLEIDLLGLAVSVLDSESAERPIVSTVPWLDGAPTHTPPIGWTPTGPDWPTCVLNSDGVLERDGHAVANPLDYGL
ncbi:MAG: hypothetical protein AAF414_10255 [Pseudomonadota bacterium]